jgi:hypothetical protein
MISVPSGIAVVVAVVIAVAAALGPSRVFSLGTSSQMYKSLSSLSAAAHELWLRSSELSLVVLPLHASDARRPSNGSRDFLLFDGVARCDSSGRDTPFATDAGGPLDLDG